MIVFAFILGVMGGLAATLAAYCLILKDGINDAKRKLEEYNDKI